VSTAIFNFIESLGRCKVRCATKPEKTRKIATRLEGEDWVMAKIAITAWMRFAIAAIPMVAFCAPAAARSGNAMIKACHGVLENDRPEASEAISQGVCMGTVFTLMQLGPAISVCPPQSSSNYQGVRVVLKFIDDKGSMRSSSALR
jgi:hypothetical protein